MRIFATSNPTAKATDAALAADMDEEIATGRDLYRQGVILQAYMDPTYSSTFMIIDAESVEAAKAKFAAYPQVREGLIEFTFTPLIGMPAIQQAHDQDKTPLPAWWPTA